MKQSNDSGICNSELVKNILSECNQSKEKGNQHFKTREWELAEKYYQESLSNLVVFVRDYISKNKEVQDESKDANKSTIGQVNETTTTADDDVNNSENITSTNNSEEEINEENNNENNNDILLENSEVLLSEKETLALISKDLDLFKEDNDNQVKTLLIVLYSNLALTFFQMSSFQRSLEYCTIILDHLDSEHYKSLYKRSQCHEQLNNYQASYSDMKKLQDIILKDPTMIPDQLAKKILLDAERLRVKSEEEQKKQLEEMWGQLKDVGGKFLGAFGININNFKFDKDPNSGSYSLSMNNNK
ncbi:predicted protein [Naegleria gruberi]|uniref:Predicted protein n=1 Tax=Naegleria gruberi TaxID=5762 RepID=D2VHP7_NAEGR|nr:uncharacterized protein NAEGRDRAFT_49629 [Naegleria gruberi]EFC43713.1 predicted protein [Naegleria gruberi]|eukprot:XP_002676457.1 predicted protein [Naegleria gruberi strain NEG-M]